MKVERNINGTPERVPEGNFVAVHSDANWYYFIETQEEADNFYKELPRDINSEKERIYREIDQKTQELIFKGFDFDGCHWSLSVTAQINWSNIPNLPEAFFPLPMQDQNGTNYQLTYANRMNFYLTAVGAKNAPLQSGNVLCSQVDALTTVEEVLSFTDPR